MKIKEFEKYAKDLNIFKIAYTKIDSEKINPNLKFNNAIILAIEMDDNIITTKPSEKAKNLNKAFYEKFRITAEKISDYLINQGFQTQIAYPNEILIDLTVLAEKAGMGHIGKNGLLISPEFGSKIKLSAILTSFENHHIKYNKEKYKWINSYCQECSECITHCEPQAL
ncbi:MAG: hypothetical protein ACRC1M_03475, partial [Methanobacteriaceae archaeon]